MKRKLSILVFIMVAIICFLMIDAFAAEEIENSQMPFIETEEIAPEYPDVTTEGDLAEEFEKMFGEGSDKILSVAMVGMFVMPLFLPALIVVIVLAVLNGKAKKKIKDYERFFGSVPQSALNTYNYSYYNENYQSQPVNPTNAPMGNAPVGSYVPQGDINNQQGGSF